TLISPQIVSLTCSYYHLIFTFFLCNATTPTVIYTLSLHDALPICRSAATCCPPTPGPTTGPSTCPTSSPPPNGSRSGAGSPVNGSTGSAPGPSSGPPRRGPTGGSSARSSPSGPSPRTRGCARPPSKGWPG